MPCACQPSLCACSDAAIQAAPASKECVRDGTGSSLPGTLIVFAEATNTMAEASLAQAWLPGTRSFRKVLKCGVPRRAHMKRQGCEL